MRNCAGLDAAAMQAVAAEMNFSETTFVLEEDQAEARVRIFTPTLELPFAGHPTLGTAWLLGRDRGVYALDLGAGRVTVTFAADGIAWMAPPPVNFGGTLPPATAAALLGLGEDDVDAVYPCRFAEVGPRFVLIGVATLAALRRAQVNPAVHAELAPAGGFLCVFAFAKEAYSGDADFGARMFFDAAGWREDPATGSANTAFAAYLRALGVTGSIIVEQGFEIARPSRLYLDIGATLRVGGKVRPVLTGGVFHL